VHVHGDPSAIGDGGRPQPHFIHRKIVINPDMGQCQGRMREAFPAGRVPAAWLHTLDCRGLAPLRD
jgi:hypothetical protein